MSNISATQPVPRFFEDPILDKAVKDQICAIGQSMGIAQAAASVEANYNVTVTREQMYAVWNEREARRMQTLSAPAPEESRPEENRQDKETVHPADRPGESLFTLPEDLPQPAPPLSMAPEPAPAPAEAEPSTRTGPGQDDAPAPAEAAPTTRTNASAI